MAQEPWNMAILIKPVIRRQSVLVAVTRELPAPPPIEPHSLTWHSAWSPRPTPGDDRQRAEPTPVCAAGDIAQGPNSAAAKPPSRSEKDAFTDQCGPSRCPLGDPLRPPAQHAP